MAKTNSKQSSPKLSTLAAKVLGNKNSSKTAKELAGSVLVQTKLKAGKKTK